MGSEKSKVELDPSIELSDDQIKLLQESTGYDRNAILEFYQNYIVNVLIFYL